MRNLLGVARGNPLGSLQSDLTFSRPGLLAALPLGSNGTNSLLLLLSLSFLTQERGETDDPQGPSQGPLAGVKFYHSKTTALPVISSRPSTRTTDENLKISSEKTAKLRS